MLSVIVVPFTRFLFYQHFEILLEHIHSSLQSQLLADKRSFQQSLLFIERRNVMRQYRMDKRADIHHLRLCLCMEIGRNRAGAKLQRIGCEKFFERMFIRNFLFRLLVDIVVQKLSGQVTH